MLFGYKFWLLLMMAVLLTLCVEGQRTVITVVDARNGEAVAFAHVCAESLKTKQQKHVLTDIQGKAVMDLTETVKLAISYIGYETYLDTIVPGVSKKVFLIPTVHAMNEVVVTAQFTPEKADKSIYKVNVINSREIQLKAATNLSDLLKTQANMRISQSGVLGSTIIIQGLSGEHVKFLIDGVPMIGRMNGNIDLNQINMNNIDHVEVIEGPMSVVYGSNAIAGVVNLITKENKLLGTNALVDLYYESVGQYNAVASFEKSNRKQQFGLTGGRNFFGGYDADKNKRSQQFIPRRQAFADAYYVLRIKALKLKLSGQYFDELQQDKGDLIAPYYELAFDSYFNTRRYLAKIETNGPVSKNSYLNFVLSGSGYERVKTTFLKDLTTLTETRASNPNYFDTTGFKSVLNRAWLTKGNPNSTMNYYLGYEINYESGKGKRIEGNEQSISDYAAFMNVKYTINKKFTAQPGLRAIYNSKYKAPLVYSMSIKYTPTEKIYSRFSYSRGFRAPSIKELYLSFFDISHAFSGNPDLKAEHSNNFNLNAGINHEKSNLLLGADVEFFYNILQNVITEAQIEGLSYTYINLDIKKTHGFSGNITINHYPKYRFKIGFARTGVLNNMESNVEKVSEFKYWTDYSFDFVYKPFKSDFTASVYFKHTGSTPRLVIENGQIAEVVQGSYNTLDVSLAHGFLKNSLRIGTGIKNFFNNKILPGVGGTGGAHSGGSGGDLAIDWGRTVFVKLTYTFNQIKK